MGISKILKMVAQIIVIIAVLLACTIVLIAAFLPMFFKHTPSINSNKGISEGEYEDFELPNLPNTDI